MQVEVDTSGRYLEVMVCIVAVGNPYIQAPMTKKTLASAQVGGDLTGRKSASGLDLKAIARARDHPHPCAAQKAQIHDRNGKRYLGALDEKVVPLFEAQRCQQAAAQATKINVAWDAIEDAEIRRTAANHAIGYVVEHSRSSRRPALGANASAHSGAIDLAAKRRFVHAIMRIPSHFCWLP
jgi:hypothetical protein